jgi:hypothetical protein
VVKSNIPLLDTLTAAERLAVQEGAAALAEHVEFQRKSYDRWQLIAKGVAPVCAIADREGMSRQARKHLLAETGFKSLNPSTVSRLLWMVRLEPAIRAWRDTLTQHQRDTWNSPTSVCNRCPAVRKAIAQEKAKHPQAPRTKTQQKIGAAVEKALDTIVDYLGHLQDSTVQRALLERLTAIIDQHPIKTAEQVWEEEQTRKKAAQTAGVITTIGIPGALIDLPLDLSKAKPERKAPALHTPQKDVKTKAFCGPTAVAAITGVPISVARNAIRQASGKIVTKAGKAHPVMGVGNKAMLKAMASLGWNVAEKWHKPAGFTVKRYTLDAFAKDYGDDGPFIVNVPGHYVAISAGEFCDTYIKMPTALPEVLAKGHGKHKRLGAIGVKQWWRFEKTAT